MYITITSCDLKLSGIKLISVLLKTFIPSLESIFSEIENQEKNTTEWFEDIKESIEENAESADLEVAIPDVTVEDIDENEEVAKKSQEENQE